MKKPIVLLLIAAAMCVLSGDAFAVCASRAISAARPLNAQTYDHDLALTLVSPKMYAPYDTGKPLVVVLKVMNMGQQGESHIPVALSVLKDFRTSVYEQTLFVDHLASGDSATVTFTIAQTFARGEYAVRAECQITGDKNDVNNIVSTAFRSGNAAEASVILVNQPRTDTAIAIGNAIPIDVVLRYDGDVEPPTVSFRFVLRSCGTGYAKLDTTLRSLGLATPVAPLAFLMTPDRVNTTKFTSGCVTLEAYAIGLPGDTARVSFFLRSPHQIAVKGNTYPSTMDAWDSIIPHDSFRMQDTLINEGMTSEQGAIGRLKITDPVGTVIFRDSVTIPAWTSGKKYVLDFGTFNRLVEGNFTMSRSLTLANGTNYSIGSSQFNWFDSLGWITSVTPEKGAVLSTRIPIPLSMLLTFQAKWLRAQDNLNVVIDIVNTGTGMSVRRIDSTMSFEPSATSMNIVVPSISLPVGSYRAHYSVSFRDGSRFLDSSSTSFTVSELQAVAHANVAASGLIAGSPANRSFHVTLEASPDKSYRVRLLNALGNVLLTSEVQRSNTARIPCADVPSGYYTVQIVDDATGATMNQGKLVVQH